MSGHTDQNLEGARKAALLLASLDPDTAATVAARLPTEVRAKLAAAQRELADLPAGELRGRIEEFRRQRARASRPPAQVSAQSPETPTPTPRPREDAPAVIPAPLREPADDTGRLPVVDLRPPLQFLTQTDPQVLAEALSRERPAVIALVALHGPAPLTRQLLTLLPAATRREVALAVAAMRPAAPGVLRCLSDELQAQVQHLLESRQSRREGARVVACALLESDASSVRDALDTLQDKNPLLADDVLEELAGLVAQRSTPVRPQARTGHDPCATHSRVSQHHDRAAWGASTAQPTPAY
ncbi:hypothetical protein LLH03_07555 [bacterium]|nr:hypothetical protein [bacterium]